MDESFRYSLLCPSTTHLQHAAGRRSTGGEDHKTFDPASSSSKFAGTPLDDKTTSFKMTFLGSPEAGKTTLWRWWSKGAGAKEPFQPGPLGPQPGFTVADRPVPVVSGRTVQMQMVSTYSSARPTCLQCRCCHHRQSVACIPPMPDGRHA